MVSKCLTLVLKKKNIYIISYKIDNAKIFIFLGYHFKVIVQSAITNEKQTRGIFKVKFNDQEEDITLLKYVSIVCTADIKYKYLYLLYSVKIT